MLGARWEFAGFTLASIVIVVLCYLLDRGPPLPPFDKIDSIDCHSLSFVSATPGENVINVHCSISENIQFPVEYLPHFISVETTTDGSFIPYGKKDLTNMSRVGSNVTFSIPHTMSGRVEVDLKCLKRTFGHFEVEFEDVNETDNEWFSRKLASKTDVARYRNVCVENDKMLFFLPNGGRGASVKFWNSEMRFEIIQWAVPWYLHKFNITRTNDTAYVIPPFDPVSWRAVLFNLLPIANSIELNSGNESRRKQLFFFRDLPPKGSGEIIKRFSTHSGAKLKDVACFKTLVFPGIGINATVEAALSANFSTLRRLFVKPLPLQRKILVASGLTVPESTAREMFPDWKVLPLSTESELVRIADAVSTTKILIADTLETLIHMIWLTPNASAVIDTAPNEHPWAEPLAARCGVAYFRAGDISHVLAQAVKSLPE